MSINQARMEGLEEREGRPYIVAALPVNQYEYRDLKPRLNVRRDLDVYPNQLLVVPDASV